MIIKNIPYSRTILATISVTLIDSISYLSKYLYQILYKSNLNQLLLYLGIFNFFIKCYSLSSYN